MTPAPTAHRLHDLAGGARLLTAEMPDRASASVVLMFGVGSRFEPERLGGASHFIEHLLFKGTTRRPSAKEIAETIEGMGGVMNAWTDKEVTCYWARVPAERVELAIDVLLDVVSDSLFAKPDIERERMVILEELKMYLDQPQDYVHSLFDEVMWPDHPLGRDIIGTVETVSGLSRDDLVGYLKEHYGLPRLVIGVAGGVEAARVEEQITSRLALPRESDGAIGEGTPAALREATVRLFKKDTEQAHICLGTRALSYLDPDRYRLDLLNAILGEGMSSRLFLEIRERRGLAYDVHSFTSKHRDAGSYTVYLGVDPGKAEEAVRAVMGELESVASRPVPEAELVKAKEYMKGRLRLGLEGTNSLASWLCQQQLLTGRIRTVDEVVALIEEVTIEDVTRMARMVREQPVQLTVVGPFSSEEPFRGAIAS